MIELLRFLTAYLRVAPTASNITNAVKAQNLSYRIESDEKDGFSVYAGEQELFQVTGPLFVRFEESLTTDLPDKCDYLLRLSTTTAHGVTSMETIAQRLVDSCGGFVFDPQRGVQTYPSEKQFITDLPKKTKKREILRAAWFIYAEKFEASRVTQKLLEIMNQCCSYSSPIKFGLPDRPLKFDLAKEGPARFAWLCEKEKGVVWNASAPCIGGELSLPFAYGLLLQDERRCVRLESNFNCAELKQSAEKLDGFIKLFTTLSSELECFYAAAFVDNCIEVRRGQIKEMTGHVNLGKTTTWAGIPAVKTWLTWFGEDLQQLVSPYLTSFQLELCGKFLQFWDIPQNEQELGDRFPIFPERLLNPESGPWMNEKIT